MIGERLRALRRANHMTQEQVAHYLNAAKSTVSQYENEVNEPDLKTVLKLADLFNVSVDYLLGREEQTANTAHTASNPWNGQLLREKLSEDEAEYLQESLAMYRKLKARRSTDRQEPS